MKSTTHAVDKSNWPDGPWMSEPDMDEWRHAGLPCLAIRSRFGNWCGYVAVPPGHPLHGIGYNACSLPEKCKSDYCKHAPESLFDVHGGLTYSNKCAGDICHVPAAGESDDVFWFGFDCGHDPYRDLAYVREQTNGLAEQLAAMENP